MFSAAAVAHAPSPFSFGAEFRARAIEQALLALAVGTCGMHPDLLDAVARLASLRSLQLPRIVGVLPPLGRLTALTELSLALGSAQSRRSVDATARWAAPRPSLSLIASRLPESLSALTTLTNLSLLLLSTRETSPQLDLSPLTSLVKLHLCKPNGRSFPLNRLPSSLLYLSATGFSADTLLPGLTRLEKLHASHPAPKL